MKNIEKYKETKDALEAWRQSVEGGVYLSFEEWAQRESEVPHPPTLLESVVSRQHAKRNLGEHGSRAVAEIMSACRFADGALDEYERAFAENARLRAALKPVLECRVRDCMFAECNDGRMKYLFDLIRSAQRIYTGGGESEVKK